MAINEIRGKSIAAVAKDIANGFFTVNPLTLKKFPPEAFKVLHQFLLKTQREVRGEKFPLHDVHGIRGRNMRLQRVHQALAVLEHSARERRIIL